MKLSLCPFVVALLLIVAPAAAEPAWRAGAAKVAITPEQPMWLSGYASRDKPAEGQLTELWAKALVLQDAAGARAALITLDLVGVDRHMADRIVRLLKERHNLERAEVAICSSHTHTGPVVGGNLSAMYFLDAQQQRLVDEYAAALPEKVATAVSQAIEAMQPAEVSAATGWTNFAVNRRNNPEGEVPRLREAGRLVGPVDYDVPVLAVRDADGRLRALAFGYACHATVLSLNQWSGDYPGYAQWALEEAHPDCVALFWAGCGADQNPLPRREVSLAQQYGRQLAAAVNQVLAGVMTPVDPRLETSYATVDVPFDKLPDRAQLESESGSDNRYTAARAKLLLAQIDSGCPLSPTYPYPVQVWRLGGERLWIHLGGEVVVDYALRLKHEFPTGNIWVAGYANDVMAYIPSRRVLTEGGYEGGGAMVYYGLPTAWAPTVEEQIIAEVHRQAKALRPAR